MEDITKDFAHIKGWGIDADPKNDPTYPMKNRQVAIKRGYSWKRPEQQPITEEVLHSIERPNVTAVFGTSVRLSGLSGMIRRFAFQNTENSYLHWLPLILADRVNVVEGLIDDVSKGNVPNIFAERGWKAKWKHNPEGLILDVAVATAITTALITIMVKGRKQAMDDLGDLVTDAAHEIGEAVSHTDVGKAGKAVKEAGEAVKATGKSVVDTVKDVPDHLPNLGSSDKSSKAYYDEGGLKRYPGDGTATIEVKGVPVENIHVVDETGAKSGSKGFLSSILGAILPG